MTMPNFLGIGAAKAGTTSLRQYLLSHPQVYIVSVRAEPRFFSSEGASTNRRSPWYRHTVTDIESYRSLFKEVTMEKAIGEISPAYLPSPNAPERIKHYVPDVKLFAILRNPVDRAHAHFLQAVKSGFEPEEFSEAIKENEIMVKGWPRTRNYIDFGFYGEQLSRYYRLFERQNIKIFLLEDLKKDPGRLVRDLYEFLEVDHSFTPDLSVNYNPSGVPRNRVIQRLLTKPYAVKKFIGQMLPKKAYQQLLRVQLQLQRRNLNKANFPEEMRQPLIEMYRQDILKLQDLINRDLSAWLESNSSSSTSRSRATDVA